MKEQIEEMARILNKVNGLDDAPAWYNDFIPDAEYLYNAGYRKQKEGEWVYRENEFGNAYYACSICDCQTRYKENYCSSCGAKMKGE